MIAKDIATKGISTSMRLGTEKKDGAMQPISSTTKKIQVNLR